MRLRLNVHGGAGVPARVLATLCLTVQVWLTGCSSSPPPAPDPAKAEASLKEAERLSGEGKPSEALAAAQKAKEADPKNGRAYVMRSQLFSQSGHFRESREELLAAHKALPDDLNVTIALLNDTQYYFPPAEAEAIARKATEKHPESAEAHYFLGQAIANGGDPDRRAEALKALEASYKLNPDATPPLVEMGKLHVRMGHPELALAVLQSAAEILDEASRQGPMPIPTLEEWLRQRKAISFWMADAYKRTGKTREFQTETLVSNRLSAQASELRMLKSRVASSEPDAKMRLQKIATKGFASR